ncbi:MAG: TonB-dependent receptor plug domain-containing protein, partial [Gemmatimonadota bacterium]|nr:TonB-dependent receptor plug domain-containing protein [Gemmatimonadota bacterium]
MSITKFLTGVALVALPALLAVPAQAQTGQIVGQVTDGQSGAPLSEVQVYIPGTGLGSLTRQDGRYILLNVAPGTYELTGERIGLGAVTQQITVAAGQTLQADFTMTSVALGLDEIVVTGTAGASRRREIGNVVSQLNAVDVPDAPLSITDMLQGVAPGLELYGGGAVGQSKIIRLRGVNSAALNDHPMIYVDGVRIRSRPFPDANPPDRRGGRSGNIAVSPLDQINPSDIERIEIIKGSAATTLYGTEASGGVIQ